MKLRIRGNSIRLRLTQSEVEQFGETGNVEEVVEFGPEKAVLSYRLETIRDGNSIRAMFEDNSVRILIPEKEAKIWTTSEKIAIEELQPLDGDRSLRILIEKDFTCLTERAGEDETDAFPNPLATAC